MLSGLASKPLPALSGVCALSSLRYCCASIVAAALLHRASRHRVGKRRATPQVKAKLGHLWQKHPHLLSVGAEEGRHDAHKGILSIATMLYDSPSLVRGISGDLPMNPIYTTSLTLAFHVRLCSCRVAAFQALLSRLCMAHPSSRPDRARIMVSRSCGSSPACFTINYLHFVILALVCRSLCAAYDNMCLLSIEPNASHKNSTEIGYNMRCGGFL